MEGFGWRGLIGKIEPAIWWEGTSWAKLLPPGFDVVVTSIGVHFLTTEELERAYEAELTAVRRLADAQVDVINMGGGPVTGVKGVEGHDELLRRAQEIAGDIPIVTSLGAQWDALRALGISSVIMLSPYADDRNENRREVLEAKGIRVTHIEALGLQNVDAIGRLPASTVHALARKAIRKKASADGFYIPCSAWPVVDAIEWIENDVGLPVVASVQAQAWACLRAIGYTGTEVRGMLFQRQRQ